MTNDWYVRRGQKTLGPLSKKQVLGALAVGRLSAETPVRRGINGAWTPAGEAFSDGVSEAPAPVRTKSPTQLPVALIGCAGGAVLVAGVWLAFELGRRQTQPANPVVRQDEVPRPHITPSSELPAVAPTRSEIVTPLVAKTEVAGAAKELPPLVSPPASPSKVGAGLTAASSVKPPQNGQLSDRTVSSDVIERSAGPVGKPLVSESKVPKSVMTVTPELKPAPLTKGPVVTKAIADAAPRPAMKAAPIVVPKAPAKDTDLSALETTARHCPTAKEALALYNHFKETRTMSPSQEATFTTNVHIWEQRAKQDLVRLGDKWVPAAEGAKAREEGTQLVAQAVEMIKILNFEEARKTLEKAGRVDPNSISANFMLGLLNSITAPQLRSPSTAIKHFQVVLRRVPGYVPALNNLAIAEVRQEKYADAIHHLREAAERSPASEEVTQNLGRFVSEAKLGRIRPNKSTLSEATRLYSKVIVTKDGTRSELQHGWRYMPLVTPKNERDGAASAPPQQDESISCVMQGTGFVVESHYVLTCRHVVDDPTLGRADRIEIIDPTDPTHQRRLPAACVEVGQQDDLCLLRCDQLEVPPITLADNVPPRGTEIVLIGFPGGSDFGLGLKTTRGVVTALPGAVGRMGGPGWLDFSRKLWYDAASSHGASGGAVCDEHGNVIAVHSTGYRPGDDPSNAKYAGGVPAPNATAFIRTSLPTFAHSAMGGPALKWTDVDAKVSPSVVLIMGGYKKVTLAMASHSDQAPRSRARQRSDDDYDDHFCTVCNGRGRTRCRAPGCLHGKMHSDEIVEDSFNMGSSKRPVIINNARTQAVVHNCRACGGTGIVRCPFCANGIDPTLR